MLCESERERERERGSGDCRCFAKEMGNEWMGLACFCCCCCIAHYIHFLLLMGGKGFINVYILPSIVLPCLLNISFENISMTCILTDPLVS